MKSIALMESISFQLAENIKPFIRNIKCYKNIVLQIEVTVFGNGKTILDSIIEKLKLDLYCITQEFDVIKLYIFSCDCYLEGNEIVKC